MILKVEVHLALDICLVSEVLRRHGGSPAEELVSLPNPFAALSEAENLATEELGSFHERIDAAIEKRPKIIWS